MRVLRGGTIILGMKTQNEFYRVELNARGAIAGLYDKAGKLELISEPRLAESWRLLMPLPMKDMNDQANYLLSAEQAAPAVRATVGYQVTSPGPATADAGLQGVDDLKQTLGYDAEDSRALVEAARAAAARKVVPTAASTAGFDDDEVVSFSGAPKPAPVKGGTQAQAVEAPDAGAATIVRIEDRAPEARKLLAEEQRREEEVARQDVRVGELEAQVAERDATIRQLGIQVEDLGRVVARLQAEARVDDEASVRVTDMERVLAAAEAEKAGIEEALEAEKARAQEAGAKAAEAADALARVTRERDQLSTEAQRWDALKHQFEEERTQVQGEVEALRRQVTETTARLAEAEGAAGRADEASRSLQALGEELTQQKVANRSYLKKISRLLEENEKLKAAPAASSGAEAETAALRTEAVRWREEAVGLRAEVAAGRLESAALREESAQGRAETAGHMHALRDHILPQALQRLHQRAITRLGGHIGHAHGEAGVAGVGRLHAVDRQAADGVGNQREIVLGQRRHGKFLLFCGTDTERE